MMNVLSVSKRKMESVYTGKHVRGNAEGDKNLMVSPATVESVVCSLLLFEHFERITKADVIDICPN